MSLSPQFLDELRSRTSLSSLIMQTTALKKAGREWKACCPFHDEKSPSFWVNDDKQFYHCFGCGAHGDAIRWMTDQRGMQFMDAVKDLAAAAGMEVPASDPRQAERDREFGEMRDIMARAARWFSERKDGSNRAMEYLEQRGVTPQVALDFETGWAPKGRGVPRLLDALSDIDVDKLITLGLVKRREEGDRAGETYDAFRGRLMFPIHDARGRVIGFGGRIIGEGEPKYLNSPDTPLFDKGRTLFNLHRASPAARKTNRLVIVEGYMDVIAMTRAGVEDVVAPNGTALTEAQMQIAWRVADVPILCMDGDKAGKAAMARAAIRALPILEAGKSLSFVTPPAGQDPDDILREQGPEAVQAMLTRKVALVDVLWAHERDAEPCDTPEAVAGLKSRMRAHVRTIRNNDVREAYGQAIAKRFAETFDAQSQGVSSGPQIRSRPTERPAFSRRAAPPPSSAAKQQIGRVGIGGEIERAVLIGLVRFPDMLRAAESVFFRNQDIDQLFEIFAEQGCTTEDALRDRIEDLQLTARLARLTEGQPMPYSFARPFVTDEAKARADLSATLKRMVRRRP